MIKNNPDDIKIKSDTFDAIYRGIIENNSDPEQRGRCKIRVFGLHTPKKVKGDTEGIPTNELPWAEPALSLIEGSISGLGLFCVPLQGAHVFLFFENGNPMQPRYFASAPGQTTVLPNTREGFSDPDGVYPTSTGNDFASEAVSTYPHNIVLAVHGGHVIEIDSTPGNKRIKVYHNSGTNINMADNGNITVTVKSGSVCTVDCDDVRLANKGSLEKLMNETALAKYNSHTHSGIESGGSSTLKPTQQMAVGTETTTETTAT